MTHHSLTCTRGPTWALTAVALMLATACPTPPPMVAEPDAPPFRPVVPDAGAQDAGQPDAGDVVVDAGTPTDGGDTPTPEPSPTDAGDPGDAGVDDGGVVGDGGVVPQSEFAGIEAKVYEGVDPDTHSISLVGTTGGRDVVALLLDLYASNGGLVVSNFPLDVIPVVEGERFVLQAGLSGLTGLDVVRYAVRAVDVDGASTLPLLADVEPLAALGQACHVQAAGIFKACRFDTLCHDDDGDFIGVCENANAGAPVLDSVTYAGPMDDDGCDPTSMFPSGLRWTFSGTSSEAIVAFDVEGANNQFPTQSVGRPPMYVVTDGLCFADAQSFAGQTLTFRVYDAAGRVSNAVPLVFPDDLGFEQLSDPPLITDGEVRLGRDPDLHNVTVFVDKQDPSSTLTSVSIRFYDANGVDVLGGPFTTDINDVEVNGQSVVQIALSGTGGLNIAQYDVQVRDDSQRRSEVFTVFVAPNGADGDACALPQNPLLQPCGVGLVCTDDGSGIWGTCIAPLGPPPVLLDAAFNQLVEPDTGYCTDPTAVGVEFLLSGATTLDVTEAYMEAPEFGGVLGGAVLPDDGPDFAVTTGLCLTVVDALVGVTIDFSVVDAAGQSSNSLFLTFELPTDGGVVDGGFVDGGEGDAGEDAGAVDAGPDGGIVVDGGTDGGEVDGGADGGMGVDSGAADGGVDGGVAADAGDAFDAGGDVDGGADGGVVDAGP